jgi:hypothetical protein
VDEGLLVDLVTVVGNTILLVLEELVVTVALPALTLLELIALVALVNEELLLLVVFVEFAAANVAGPV